MNILKKLRNLFQKKKNDDIELSALVYMTDDLEQARKVQAEHPDVCVEYHSCNSEEPSPIHIYVMSGGRPITKQNPEYIEYLENNNPDMSEDEIDKLIREASEKKLHEWLEENAQEGKYKNQEDDKIEDSTTIEESKPKQKLKK